MRVAKRPNTFRLTKACRANVNMIANELRLKWSVYPLLANIYFYAFGMH